MNRFGVGAVGKGVRLNSLGSDPRLTPAEALNLAAWLVAVAAPIGGRDVGETLDRFLRDVVEASDGELGDAVKQLGE